jgi:hypothetical protein
MPRSGKVVAISGQVRYAHDRPAWASQQEASGSSHFTLSCSILAPVIREMMAENPSMTNCRRQFALSKMMHGFLLRDCGVK